MTRLWRWLTEPVDVRDVGCWPMVAIVGGMWVGIAAALFALLAPIGTRQGQDPAEGLGAKHESGK